MHLPKNLHLRTGIFVGLMIIFGAGGDVLLSKGMKQIGAVSTRSLGKLAVTFYHTFTSATIWLGIISLLLFFACYLSALSWADYTFVQPASASSYVAVALGGAFLLGESVSPIRWAGVLLICVGVLLIGHTPPRTTARSQ